MLVEEDECDVAEYVDVPKVLGDLFESLIGAIYLDNGKNLTKVWEIIYSLMHKEIGNICMCVCARAHIHTSVLSNLIYDQIKSLQIR